jgi:hypothetical protein
MKNAGMQTIPQTGIVALCKSEKKRVETTMPLVMLNFRRFINSIIAIITSDSSTGEITRSTTAWCHQGKASIRSAFKSAVGDA